MSVDRYRRWRFNAKAWYANYRHGGRILTRHDIEKLHESCKNCFYCGVEVDDRSGTVEHIDPAAGNASDNLTIACVRCNSSKGSASATAYAIRLASRGIRHAALPASVLVQKPLPIKADC